MPFFLIRRLSVDGGTMAANGRFGHGILDTKLAVPIVAEPRNSSSANGKKRNGGG